MQQQDKLIEILGINIPEDIKLIAGVDEVGRGPLAGPVVAAAVILAPHRPIADLADSKKLSAKQREILSEQIKRDSVAWALGRAEVEEIDRINILHASLLAMQRAVSALATAAQLALVDGNRCPQLPCRAIAVVKGDARVACISAASIIAKVARDHEMLELDKKYPAYGFARHKGYPTKIHMENLRQHGVSEIHRRSFRPVRECLKSGE